MYLRHLIAGILLIAAVTFSEPTSEILKPGTAAPTFSLPSLSSGRQSLRVWCGDKLLKPHINKTRHTVILSFWATYCKPCKKEIPELMKFSEKHKTDSITIFCISIDKEGSSIVAPFVKKSGFTLPILLDPYRKTAERYGVKKLPALFVIDGKGTIRYSSVGYEEKEPLDTKLESIISDIRSGKTVSAKAESETAESVEIEETKGADTSGPSPLKAKERWNAIVAVECGMPLQKLADSLGVQQEEIRSWYSDLKKAAISLWESDTTEKK
jgi:peroxiredoxin